jgi:hypothetical protein
MVGAPVHRRQVAYLQQGGVSIRRACALMSVARWTLNYRSRLVQRDAPVVAAMCKLAAQIAGSRSSWSEACDECRSYPPAMASARSASTEKTASATGRKRPSAPVAGNGRGTSGRTSLCSMPVQTVNS